MKKEVIICVQTNNLFLKQITSALMMLLQDCEPGGNKHHNSIKCALS